MRTLGIYGLNFAVYFLLFDIYESFILPLKIGKSSSALSSLGECAVVFACFCAINFYDSRLSS